MNDGNITPATQSPSTGFVVGSKLRAEETLRRNNNYVNALDVSSLINGMYTYKVETEFKVFSGKFNIIK